MRAIPEGMEAREEYQAVAVAVVTRLMMVLVEPEAVGRYGYGIGSSTVMSAQCRHLGSNN